MSFLHAQQPLGRDGLMGTLDLNKLRLSEAACAFNQSRCGRAEHHPARRCHRLHPLSHPHLLTDGGVTERARTDLTGDHLAGIEANPQLQFDTVAALDLFGKPLRLVLHTQRRQAGANGVVLQRNGRTEDSHDPVAGETADRAAKVLHHHGSPINQLGHDLAQPLCTDRRCDLHRVHHVGEQHRDLLVLRRSGGLCQRCTALVAELGVRWQFGAAGPTGQPRRGQSTATIPAGVHVSIVSPLVNDVRHIAVPASRRSFEALECRLFRHTVDCSS